MEHEAQHPLPPSPLSKLLYWYYGVFCRNHIFFYNGSQFNLKAISCLIFFLFDFPLQDEWFYNLRIFLRNFPTSNNWFSGVLSALMWLLRPWFNFIDFFPLFSPSILLNLVVSTKIVGVSMDFQILLDNFQRFSPFLYGFGHSSAFFLA